MTTISVGGKIGAGYGSAVIRPRDALRRVSHSEHSVLLSSLSLCSVYKWPKMNPAMIQRMQGS